MRNRVAIAVAKRERERRAAEIAAAPAVTEKSTSKKAKKTADVTLASVDTEVADEIIANDPKTMEDPKPE